MKLNAHTALHTPTVTLVPYSLHHVPKYHAWMQSPTLRALTASEPLSLAQEHAMQHSWRNDGDKLTFIVCTSQTGETHTGCSDDQEDEIRRMVGDVNVFFHEEEEEEEGGGGGGGEEVNGHSNNAPHVQIARPVLLAELEIMIADPKHRGKGFATAALQALLCYLHRHADALLAEYTAFTQSESQSQPQPQPQPQPPPSLTHLRVKIAADNAASMGLFERLGFTRVGSGAPNYFNEVEMRMDWAQLGRLVLRGLGVREMVYTSAEVGR